MPATRKPLEFKLLPSVGQPDVGTVASLILLALQQRARELAQGNQLPDVGSCAGAKMKHD